MKVKSAYLYLSLIIIHALLILIAFPALFQHSGNTMFSSTYDGLKNYFTLSSFIKEPVGNGGILKYSSFSYPFGDYVYYTDNTPLFSIPFRWFCNHIYNVSDYAIPAFNFFILSNILISALLVFFIFKRLIGENIFSYGLAIILPWINIQAPRIWQGDFNLSCTTPVLFSIALFILWYNNGGNVRKQTGIAACMVLLLFCSFLIHGYYIAILTIFLSGMLFFLGIWSFRNKSGKQDLLASVIIPVLGLGGILLLLQLTDKYLSLRQPNAMGYDASSLKTNFLLLFTHYDFHSLAFPIASTMPENGEMMVYLGNIGLFAFAAIWIGAVFSIEFRKRVFSIQKAFFSDPLKRSLFLSAALAFVISFGEYYHNNRDVLKIYTPVPWINNMDTGKLLIAILLITLSVYAIILIASPAARNSLNQIRKDYVQRPYKKAGFLFCVALMIYLFVARYSVTIVNILNPFLYVHFFTNRVEQFRCLSRFSWPFFWAFYIWIMFTVIQLYSQSGKKIKGIILILFILVGSVEIRDYIAECRHEANNTNLFSQQQLKNFNSLKIDFKQYQAILPIPYYIVGSEDYPHTIDDNNAWSTYTMQLSLYSHLPLMSCKMSRTPPAFSIALLDLVCNDILQPVLKNKLNDKPILIPLEKTLINDPQQIDILSSGRPLTKIYYAKAIGFVARHHLSPIDSMGNLIFYSWVPQ